MIVALALLRAAIHEAICRSFGCDEAPKPRLALTFEEEARIADRLFRSYPQSDIVDLRTAQGVVGWVLSEANAILIARDSRGRKS